MANLCNEDQMDADVEQELLGTPATVWQMSILVVRASEPVQPHIGYPVYAVPQHLSTPHARTCCLASLAIPAHVH